MLFWIIELSFSRAFAPGNENSWEQSSRKRKNLYGTFAPGSEIISERKFLLPPVSCLLWRGIFCSFCCCHLHAPHKLCNVNCWLEHHSVSSLLLCTRLAGSFTRDMLDQMPLWWSHLCQDISHKYKVWSFGADVSVVGQILSIRLSNSESFVLCSLCLWSLEYVNFVVYIFLSYVFYNFVDISWMLLVVN